MSKNAANNYLFTLPIQRYSEIIKTLINMMKARGYTPEGNISSHENWVSKYIGILAATENGENVFNLLDELCILFSNNTTRHKTLAYFYIFDTKFAQDEMNHIYNLKKSTSVQKMIIITKKETTPKVSNVLNTISNVMQLFNENELLFDVTSHQMVPKHILASKEETERMFNTYAKLADGLYHPELFPGIYTTDPIVKYHDWSENSLIRIERPRPDGFVDITYRIVTAPLNEKKDDKRKT